MAALESGKTAADLKAAAQPVPDPAAAARLAAESPLYNSMMRSTCVATQLTGGHAENALPQLARAVVNCRLLPGSDPRAVEQALKTGGGRRRDRLHDAVGACGRARPRRCGPT